LLSLLLIAICRRLLSLLLELIDLLLELILGGLVRGGLFVELILHFLQLLGELLFVFIRHLGIVELVGEFVDFTCRFFEVGVFHRRGHALGRAIAGLFEIVELLLELFLPSQFFLAFGDFFGEVIQFGDGLLAIQLAVLGLLGQFLRLGFEHLE
jgi:hypothetical protein